MLLKYKIELKSFGHFGSGMAQGRADNGIVRDATGNPYIPGSTVKGRVRAYAEAILHARHKQACTPFQKICGDPSCAVCSLFGWSGGNGGKIFFSDAIVEEEFKELGKYLFSDRDNVMISRSRDVAMEGHLFKTETCIPGIRFTGEIEGEMMEAERQLVIEAISVITHIGGNKSRGMGRCQITTEEVVNENH